MLVSEIITDVRRKLGGITSSDYSDANIILAVNRGQQAFTLDAILSNGKWQVSGEIATANLVASQAEYVFPTSIMKIHRIEANPTGNSNTWVLLPTTDLRTEKSALSNTISGSVSSLRADMFDNSIFLIPTPTASVTAGLKVWYTIEPTDLISSDTPNLPAFSHTGLVDWACLDFVIGKKQSSEIVMYKQFIDETRKRIKDYYAVRVETEPARIRPRTESYE